MKVFFLVSRKERFSSSDRAKSKYLSKTSMNIFSVSMFFLQCLLGEASRISSHVKYVLTTCARKNQHSSDTESICCLVSLALNVVSRSLNISNRFHDSLKQLKLDLVETSLSVNSPRISWLAREGEGRFETKELAYLLMCCGAFKLNTHIRFIERFQIWLSTRNIIYSVYKLNKKFISPHLLICYRWWCVSSFFSSSFHVFYC